MHPLNGMDGIVENFPVFINPERCRCTKIMVVGFRANMEYQAPIFHKPLAPCIMTNVLQLLLVLLFRWLASAKGGFVILL
jgi:hypothetical protein